jgi:hypothetical protein
MISARAESYFFYDRAVRLITAPPSPRSPQEVS